MSQSIKNRVLKAKKSTRDISVTPPSECHVLGVIQIIRDTLGGGEVRQNVTKTFFDFLNAALNAFGSN
jgi:hypothetical protein